MVHDQVDVAVVVDVAIGDAAADMVGIEVGPAFASRAETLPSRFGAARPVGVGIASQPLEVIVDVAVGDEAIGPAVVVEVGQRTAPADPEHTVVHRPPVRVRSSKVPRPG